MAQEPEATDGGRGRSATTPRRLGLKGWRDVVWRVANNMSRHNVSLMAAGVAFYALLSIAPAMAAIVAVYGLFFDPADVSRQVQDLSGLVPPGSEEVLQDQLADVTTTSAGKLSAGASIAVLLAIYGATRGISGLMMALNVAYGEFEKRNILAFYATAYALTACAVLVVIVSLAAIVIVPVVMKLFGVETLSEELLAVMRWPFLATLFAVSLAVLYRFGPSRRHARWRWIWPGAVLATALWLAGSLCFSLYVRLFAGYTETYGSLGAVVILLMWFWLSGYIVILGAEIGAEAERQTKRDTTRPPPGAPIGRRGARVADTVGPVP